MIDCNYPAPTVKALSQEGLPGGKQFKVELLYMHEICKALLRPIENNNRELEPLGVNHWRRRVNHSLRTRSAGSRLTEWLSHSSLMPDALSETGFVNRKAGKTTRCTAEPAKLSLAKITACRSASPVKMAETNCV